MTQARSLPLVALALALATLVIQVRVVAGGKTWDDVRYHTEVAPPRLAASAAVRHGALPGWWDGTGFGVPLAAEPAHGALYPPVWLAASPRALDLIFVLHLLWAGLGVAVWARRAQRIRGGKRQGASERAAVVAGILVMTTGVLASAAIRGALPGLAHVPWVGAATVALADATDRRSRARAVIAVALLLGAIGLAGELAILVDALALVLVLGARRIPARWLAAALLGGVAIAAVQWLPALLHFAAGDRGGAAIDRLPLARLLELIVPGSFGAQLGGGTPWAPSLYVGAPLIALASIVLPERRTAGFLVTLCALSLLVGIGGWPAWLGAPELHVCVLVLVLGPAAAAGIDALLAGQRRGVLALGAGAGCTLLALAAIGALRARHPDAAPAIDRALVDGGLGVLCLGGAVGVVLRTRARFAPVVLLLLVIPGIGAIPSVSRVTDRANVTEPPLLAAAVDEPPRPARVFRPAIMADVGDSLLDAVATLRGAVAERWGLDAARSDDPARPAAHDQVWLAAARDGGQLLDRFGIALAILPATVVNGNRMHALGARGAWSLVELPVAPLASVARGWSWSTVPKNAMELMFAPAGGTNIGRGTVVLSGTGDSHADRGPPVPCAVQTWEPGDIDLVCTPDAEGYAVVTSTPSPGWSVSVDGVAADWLTADVLRRAVFIGAGMHHVHWRYVTPALRVAIVLALIALAGLIALYFGTRRVVPPADVN